MLAILDSRSPRIFLACTRQITPEAASSTVFNFSIMPKFLSVLSVAVAVSAGAALVFAQEASPAQGKLAAASTSANETGEQNTSSTSTSEKPSEKSPAKSASKAGDPPAAPAAEVAPTPTPKPHHRNFFEWLFGSHRHKATPTPAAMAVVPSPTPRRSARRTSNTPEAVVAVKPTPTPRAGSTTPKPSPTPRHTAKSETTPKSENPETTPKPESAKPEKVVSTTPAPAAVTPPKATPSRKGKTKATPSASPEGAAAAEDADTKEQARFEAARTKALDDPHVKSLKDKADAASTEEESHTTLRAYNKALFEKIRKIDPSVSDYSDQLEKAILKRLGE